MGINLNSIKNVQELQFNLWQALIKNDKTKTKKKKSKKNLKIAYFRNKFYMILLQLIFKKYDTVSLSKQIKYAPLPTNIPKRA